MKTLSPPRVKPADLERVEGVTYPVLEKLYLRSADVRVGPSPYGPITAIDGRLIGITRPDGRMVTGVIRPVPNTMATEVAVIHT